MAKAAEDCPGIFLMEHDGQALDQRGAALRIRSKLALGQSHGLGKLTPNFAGLLAPTPTHSLNHQGHEAKPLLSALAVGV